jgi:hypothetical protein
MQCLVLKTRDKIKYVYHSMYHLSALFSLTDDDWLNDPHAQLLNLYSFLYLVVHDDTSYANPN